MKHIGGPYYTCSEKEYNKLITDGVYKDKRFGDFLYNEDNIYILKDPNEKIPII